MSQQLPAVPSLEQLKKQAKDLRKAFAAREAAALALVGTVPEVSAAEALSAAQSQLAIARKYGFESWPKLKHHVEAQHLAATDKAAAFIEAALSTSPSNNTPREFEAARALLASEPALASANLYTACVSGEISAAERFLAKDPGLAKKKGGPKDREPLLYLSFSRFLLNDPQRREGLLKLARKLLELGADPKAEYIDKNHPDDPQTALYGASGINGNPELTKMLLEAGAHPNDTESLYHASEWPDNASLKLLLEARPKPEWVSYCLAHKLDFEDYEGVKLYLDHGADPNFVTPFGERWTRLHHAIERGRSAKIVELMVQRGGDLSIRDVRGHTPYALAVRLGRSEVAKMLRGHGETDTELSSIDVFLGACAVGDETAIRSALSKDPQLITKLTDHDHWVITDAATYGRTEIVRAMLAAGFKPEWADTEGATALHRASFSGHSEIVKLLIAHQAPLELRDNNYQGTPLNWALAGTVKNPWTNPAGDYVAVVKALLAAGAKVPANPHAREDVMEVLVAWASRP